MLIPNVSFEMNMIFHSIVIALLLYMILHFWMNYSRATAQKYSIAVGIVVLIYMSIFGHQLPRFGVMYY
jgi:hypothetical protein